MHKAEPVVRAQDAPSMKIAVEPEPAIGGYCPVSYRSKSAPTRGNPAFSSTFNGLLYYFADSDMKQLFDADPNKFAPQFGGLCATALGGSYLKRKASDPIVFEIRADKLYLFSSERAKSVFVENPAYFIGRAEQFIVKPALDGYCPVSYQTENKSIKGSPGTRSIYKHFYYHFASQKNKQLFDADPEKYIPKYDGLCAEGVSRGKRFPADASIFAVHEDRTYLFFDDAARKKFLADPQTMARAADAQATSMPEEKRTGERPAFRDP
jgi:YHS domain-containing protein